MDVERLLLVSSILLWSGMMLNMTLTLRILRWIRANNEARMVQQKPVEQHQSVVIGTPAPDFKARTLTGQPIRLDNYAGHSVAFIFISPACGHCRLEMPVLTKLAPLAKKNADVEIILVSDWGPIVTEQWLAALQSEDGVDVQLPIVVAPRGKTDFLDDYNPEGRTPSFCLLDAQSKVQARGEIPSMQWKQLKRSWEGTTKLAPFMFKNMERTHNGEERRES